MKGKNFMRQFLNVILLLSFVAGAVYADSNQLKGWFALGACAWALVAGYLAIRYLNRTKDY